MGQLLGLSPPSVFGAVNRAGGYSMFKVLSKDLQEHFLKIDLKKKLQLVFCRSAKNWVFCLFFIINTSITFFVVIFSKIPLVNFFNNRLEMLNLKFYVSTCKIVGGDSQTS